MRTARSRVCLPPRRALTASVFLAPYTTPPSDINTLRILITTDNHIGYEERDPVRGDDSFLAFDEALGVAAQQKV